MRPYTVVEVAFGSQQYEQTIQLRDAVMRKPLGLSIANDDLSFERNAIIFAVFETDLILGTGTLVFEGLDFAKIRSLCVDTTLQKSGVGRAIVEEIEKRSRERGIQRIGLESRLSAKEFYKKMGFHEQGEEYFMDMAPIGHIWMEKAL